MFYIIALAVYSFILPIFILFRQFQRFGSGGSRICHLFPLRLRLLILSFRGTLEALQGIFYACSECFRAKCFEKPTPPAWWEDEVSTILDSAGGRIDWSAGDVWFHLQAQWEKSMQAELASFGIDLFDFENEVQGAAKGFSCEVDGLAYGGWTFWLTPFYMDRAIKPLGIAFPSYEIPPDHLNRRCDDVGGTDCQTHSMFLLIMGSLLLFGARGIKPRVRCNGRKRANQGLYGRYTTAWHFVIAYGGPVKHPKGFRMVYRRRLPSENYSTSLHPLHRPH